MASATVQQRNAPTRNSFLFLVYAKMDLFVHACTHGWIAGIELPSDAIAVIRKHVYAPFQSCCRCGKGVLYEYAENFTHATKLFHWRMCEHLLVNTQTRRYRLPLAQTENVVGEIIHLDGDEGVARSENCAAWIRVTRSKGTLTYANRMDVLKQSIPFFVFDDQHVCMVCKFERRRTARLIKKWYAWHRQLRVLQAALS